MQLIKSIVFYNLSGDKVKEVSTEITDISKLPAGTYFIKVTTESGKKASDSFVKY